eukprot:gene6154-6781_t
MEDTVAARKRSRRSKESSSSEINDLLLADSSSSYSSSTFFDNNPTAIDNRLFHVQFPKQHESKLAAAIFELGLKNSSPKLLIPFMPMDANLTTEHIKSHLQKYRIHKQRSKDEFCIFYEHYIQGEFDKWEERHGWEEMTDLLHNSGSGGGGGGGGGGGSSSDCSEGYGGMKRERVEDDDEREENNYYSETTLEALEQKQKELNRLQEILQTSTNRIEQWKKLVKEISHHGETMARDLQSLTATTTTQPPQQQQQQQQQSHSRPHHP